MIDIANLFRKIKILGTPNLEKGQKVWLVETEKYPRATRFYREMAEVVGYNPITRSYNLELLSEAGNKEGTKVTRKRNMIYTSIPLFDG